ncbi:MAG: hypothetical protein ABIJ74_04475 [archaeon]
MDRKGFTLFTALVSFVLILLSAMIVQTMIKAERDRTEVISNIEEQAEMQSMADLTRAEALQTFNYTLRKEIEEFFDYTERHNTIQITPQEYSFEQTKENFAQRFFGTYTAGNTTQGDQFVNQVVITLFSALPGKKFVGAYEISVEFKGENEVEKGTITRNAVKELLEKSVQAGNFFEVVDCENGDPENCLGTFYLNLKTEDLSDEVYESFPQIKVYNPRTQRVLQESIFPRGNIKLYVPVRLFKAIAEARSLALEYNKEEGSLWKDNYGLFSPRIHNEIEEMKLGLCDPNYCNVRSNPYLPPDKKNMDFACPNIGNSYSRPVKCTQDLIERGICSVNGQTIISYNPNTYFTLASQETALSKIVATRLCFIANHNSEEKFLDANSLDDFMLGSMDKGLCEIKEGQQTKGIISIEVNPVTRNSVKINNTGGSVDEHHPDGFSGSYKANENLGGNSSCAMTSSANSSLWGTYGVAIEDNKIVQKTSDAASFLGFPPTGDNEYATCSEVGNIIVKVPFKETNKNYIINKTKQPVFVVELTDNKFTPASDNTAFHQAKKFEVDSTTCAMKSTSVQNDFHEDDWKCKNTISGGGSFGGPGNAAQGGCETL